MTLRRICLLPRFETQKCYRYLGFDLFQDEPGKSITSFRWKVTAVFLQGHVLQCALDGDSIFFTGPAGSGKSFLLKEIAKQLRAKYGVSCFSLLFSFNAEILCWS